ncbi:MAG: hypothetical protein IRZ16_08455 [Myxococcaceae bacterium]|nr:hypothetical protein [Myxococcaceae bacterium]
MTTTAAPIAARSPYIVSPGFDAVFFFGSTASVLMAWAAASLFHVNGFYVLAAVAVVSNGPHLVATWTRVYFDKREWRKRPWQIFLGPVVITAAVVAVLQGMGFKGSRVLNTALLYWAVWHFVQQNWGLLRIYQKRSGEPDSSWALRLERPMLYVFVAWCMLHRLQTGPRRLFGTEVYYVPIPLWAVNVLLVVSCLLAAAWIVLRLREGRVAWTTSALLRGGFLACAALGFFVPFLLITTDDTSGFAAAACWHGLQYIGIVHFYHRNAWKGGVHPDARLVSWLTQPGWLRLFGFAVLLWALAASGYGVIYVGSLLTRGTSWNIYTWGSVVWLSLTFSHYYLDGVIWKISRDPKVAQRLAVAA